MTSGSSVTRPKAMMICAAKPKYLSTVMIGSRMSRWKLSSTIRARGSTQRYAAAAPARNSSTPIERAGTITRFSRSYSAGARNAQIW